MYSLKKKKENLKAWKQSNENSYVTLEKRFCLDVTTMTTYDILVEFANIMLEIWEEKGWTTNVDTCCTVWEAVHT